MYITVRLEQLRAGEVEGGIECISMTAACSFVLSSRLHLCEMTQLSKDFEKGRPTCDIFETSSPSAGQ